MVYLKKSWVGLRQVSVTEESVGLPFCTRSGGENHAVCLFNSSASKVMLKFLKFPSISSGTEK